MNTSDKLKFVGHCMNKLSQNLASLVTTNVTRTLMLVTNDFAKPIDETEIEMTERCSTACC